MNGRMTMRRLLLIEGLPGSGKTTFAKRLADHFRRKGKRTDLATEGDLHPMDLAWVALLTKEEYDRLLKTYSAYALDIRNHTDVFGEWMRVAYTKVRVEKEDIGFYGKLEQKEIYREKELSVFKSVHQTLWQRFADKHMDEETLHIYECVFLQNHMNELILKHGMDDDAISDYYRPLISAIRPMDPLVVYIRQRDVKKTICRVAEERRGKDSPATGDWIDLVTGYIEAMPYAKEKGYAGEEGAITYFKDRQTKETSLLGRLDIDHVVVDLDGDYDETFSRMLDFLQRDSLYAGDMHEKK